MTGKTKVAKPSISHFKPNFKPLGFTAPRWQITNYVAKFHAHITNHPIYKRFSAPQGWQEPEQKKK